MRRLICERCTRIAHSLVPIKTWHRWDWEKWRWVCLICRYERVLGFD